jgi:hypothetical protein
VTHEPTEQTTHPTIGGQAAVYDALAALARQWPDLPAAYTTVHTADGNQAGLQLESPAEFEQWRAALGIAPETVEFHLFNGTAWLAACGTYCGVSLKLTGHGIQPPADPVPSSGQLAEQRHLLDTQDVAYQRVVLA